MDFEKKYKRLIKTIHGDNENVLSFDPDHCVWCIQAVNPSIHVSIGEVMALINVTAPTLELVLIEFEKQIIIFNHKTLGEIYG